MHDILTASSPPEFSFVKLNADAGLCSTSGCFSYGAVFCGHDGQILAPAMKCIRDT